MAVMSRRSRSYPKSYRIGSYRALFGRIDPIAIVGILLSASLSIALDVTGAATGVESLLAGLMGTMISLQIDALARAERRFHLRKLVEGAPWIGAALAPIVEGTREAVERFAGTPVEVEARNRYQRLRAETDQLRLGRIIRPGNDYQDLFAATRTANARLDAMTNVMPRASGELSWWKSEVGRHYWQINLEAIARGVVITRLFAYAVMTEELKRFIEEQRQAGVRVGLLAWGTVAQHLHLNIAIWDGGSSWEGRMSAHGEITENQFSVNPEDVARLQNVFTVCRSVASMLD